MKAKFVFENLNFERKKDPKKIMGLGIPIFGDYVIDDNNQEGRIVGVYKMFKDTGENNDWFNSQHLPVHYKNEIWVDILLHGSGLILVPASKTKNIKSFKFISPFESKYFDANETYNFKRNLRPQEALKIGRKLINPQEAGTDHLEKQGYELGYSIYSLEELKIGEEYAILDLGLNQWNAGYEYKGLIDNIYYFKDTLTGLNDEGYIEGVSLEYLEGIGNSWKFTIEELMEFLENGNIAIAENY